MVAIPSAASEAAGEATEGTAAEPFARMAGAILGGGVPAALGKASAARAAIQSTPTAEALYQAGRNQYKQIKNLGVEIDPVPIGHLMDSVENDLTQDGLTARNVPETYGVINTLKYPPPGGVLTAQNFDSARQELLQATKNATNRREAAAAWPVINRLDDYLANIPASHVLQGDAQQAAQLFGNARGNWAAAKRADIVGGKLDLAELNAATANSGTNIDNATRQAVKQLLRPDNYGRTLAEKSGFNANEIALMNSVARGTATGNTLRFVGKLLGGGGGIAQALIGGAGAAASYETGDPRYLALPLIGIGAKKLSDISTARRAAALDQAVRMRSPLAASMQASAGLPQGTLTQFQRAVLNAIAARQGAVQPAQQRQALPSF